MALAAGARLGPYQVIGVIAAGGMGEVYDARDTRLDRHVAIKVLRDDVSRDPDRRARFEREARTVATLSHPHICTLYDVGEHESSLFLVMELLDGPTLAERLRKGPLPVEEALEYGAQIADALAAAHRAGIVHRDLKPANVMLTKSGVKLLDFGLAKLKAEAVATLEAVPSGVVTQSEPLTRVGTILGTLQYMAPEQLQGREADARTDIWALGLVLYEMVIGSRAFDEPTGAALIAAILDRQPAPPPDVKSRIPPGLERLILRCLAKDADERWQSAADVAVQLRWSVYWAASDSPVRVRSPRRTFVTGAAVATALCVIAGAIVLARLTQTTASSLRSPLAVTIAIPTELRQTGMIALSPDGGAIAFSATRSDGASGIWIRDLHSFNVRLLGGTDGGIDPFWSPGGDALAFFTQDAMKRVELAGGPASIVTTVANGARGGTWNAADEIVFGQDANRPLYRVSAKGGRAHPLTALDVQRGDTTHRFPNFLPDGRRLLFLLQSRASPPCVATVSLDDPQAVACVVAGESSGAYAGDAIYFMRGRSLMTQPFDLTRVRVSGTTVAVVDGVWRDFGTGGRAGCAVSAANVIACRESPSGPRVAWVDARGQTVSTIGPEGSANPVLSPDGRRMLVSAYNPETLKDRLLVLEGDSSWPLSPPTMNVELQAWRPDGREVVFGSDAGGTFDLYRQSVERGSSPRLFYQSPAYDAPTDWSRDGEWILFNHDAHIFRISSAGGEPVPVTRGPARENGGRCSPDGRWIAYNSDESGREEVYLIPFDGGEPVPVSTGGGSQAQWGSDGRELFFVRPDGSLMSVGVDAHRDRPILAAPRQVLAPGTIFDSGFDFSYAVGADGHTFAVNTHSDLSVSNRLRLLVGWTPPSSRASR